jgi:hypothetical protein
MPRPRILVYPLVTIIAEKLEALVKLGMSNTRMKDFHDLSQIARNCDIDGVALSEAVLATFDRRGTPIPQVTPIALTAEFYDSRRKRNDWNAFLRRHSIPRSEHLAAACADIERFLTPVVRLLATGDRFCGDWRDGRWT